MLLKTAISKTMHSHISRFICLSVTLAAERGWETKRPYPRDTKGSLMWTAPDWSLAATASDGTLAACAPDGSLGAGTPNGRSACIEPNMNTTSGAVAAAPFAAAWPAAPSAAPMFDLIAMPDPLFQANPWQGTMPVTGLPWQP